MVEPMLNGINERQVRVKLKQKAYGMKEGRTKLQDSAGCKVFKIFMKYSLQSLKPKKACKIRRKKDLARFESKTICELWVTKILQFLEEQLQYFDFHRDAC